MQEREMSSTESAGPAPCSSTGCDGALNPWGQKNIRVHYFDKLTELNLIDPDPTFTASTTDFANPSLHSLSCKQAPPLESLVARVLLTWRRWLHMSCKHASETLHQDDIRDPCRTLRQTRNADTPHSEDIVEGDACEDLLLVS